MNLPSWLVAIVDLIFPRHCCICDKFLKNSRFLHLCDYCESQLCWITEPVCSSCGRPFAGDVSTRVCLECRVNPPRFNKAMSLWMFQGVAREIIHKLKYKSGEYILPDIGAMISKNQAMVELISQGVLVPVPIHWRRFFSRGYNQSELIAKVLCKIAQNSTMKNLLVKKRHNRSQTELGPEARVENVIDSFAMRKNVDLPKNTKLIVVDDVMTTGATVNECVKQLNDRGYFDVSVVTLARD